jgi:hypothetical protein
VRRGADGQTVAYGDTLPATVAASCAGWAGNRAAAATGGGGQLGVGSQGEASALRAEGEQRTLAADEAVQEGRGQRRKDAGGAGTTGAARTSLILLSGQTSTKHAELPQRKCECKPEFTFSVSLSAVWTIISSRARRL